MINTIWYDLASQGRTREGGAQLLVFDNLSLAGIASQPASQPCEARGAEKSRNPQQDSASTYNRGTFWLFGGVLVMPFWVGR